MKAYVARNRSGAVTRGLLLRQETSIGSPMCRLSFSPADERVEEVSLETAVHGAGSGTSQPGVPRFEATLAQTKPRTG